MHVAQPVRDAAPAQPQRLLWFLDDWRPDQAHVRGLLRYLLTRYGARFTELYAGVTQGDLVQLWGIELRDLQADEVIAGVDALRKAKWPPTAGEFVEWCRPAIDPEQSHAEAVAQMVARQQGSDRWSHPAIYWAATTIGQHDLLHLSWQQIRARWCKALDAQLSRSTWPDVPPRREALPAPGETTLSREQADAVMADLRAKVAPPPSRKVGLAWAQAVLQRHADGDQSLPAISLQFAREALGIDARAGA
jgi:hypothetical protein